MATTAPGKIDWIVIVPDKPGMREKRLEVRGQHLEGVKPLKESGRVKMGGGVFSEVPQGTDPKNWPFCGSTLNVLADTREEVVELLKNDVYASSGVWDVEKAQIWPAVLAFRSE